jgi:hypothetical protein
MGLPPMSKQTIYATVIDCELAHQPAMELLASLAFHNGKDIRITIERKRKPMSNPMHAYYRDYVLPTVYNHYLDKGINITIGQVHKCLKETYGPDENVGIEEPVFRKKQSMSEYTKEESIKFMDDLRQSFAELHYLDIGEPNEHLQGRL